MNQRGVIFTLMTFLMVLAIFYLNNTIRESLREGQKISELIAIGEVENKSLNIERAIIDLDKDGRAKETNERFLPFAYDLNKDLNYLRVQQQLPLKPITLESFFDVINQFEVFLEDTNRSNVFDGLPVDVNTLKNGYWGGSANTLHFLIEPFCYEYSLSLNEALFADSNSEKCFGEFQDSDLRRFDLNIMIRNSNEDFNSLLCNGTSSCPQQAFNPSDPLPYYRIEIDDSNCSNCVLSQKVVGKHFNPTEDFNVVLSCVGTACVSSPVIVSHHGLDFNVFHSSDYRLDIAMKPVFNGNIDNFYFLDFNVSVRHFSVNALKKNN